MLAGFSVFAVSPITFAVTADDVQCVRCVDAPDIAGQAVNEWKLAPNSVSTDKIQNVAVTSAKIAPQAVGEWKLKTDAVSTTKIQDAAVTADKIQDGAIDYDKLDPLLQADIDNAAPVDYRDYGTATNVTQTIFALQGSLSDCNGTGTQDTLVRDISRTDLGGGTTQVVLDERNYTGGPSGTLCSHYVNTYIANPEATMWVRAQGYDIATDDLLWDKSTGYDPITCPDCGMVYRRADMQLGIDFASVSFWSESVSGESSVAATKVVLTKVDSSETINKGELDEETFDSCIHTWAERRSAQVGSGSRLRVHCDGVGLVYAVVGRLDNPWWMYMELVSYTTAD